MSYVVFEGIDGAGKTTIARKVANQLGWAYVKTFGDNQWVLNEFPGANSYIEDLAVMDLCNQTGFSIVADRGIVSAEVYGLQNYLFLEERWKKAWQLVAPTRTFYVWLRRPIRECRLERFSEEKLGQLDERFAYWYKRLPSGVVKEQYLNSSNVSINELAAKIAKDIRERIG